MKAAVLSGPGRAEIVDAAMPVPSTDEVRVRLEGCGVCASNLVPWAGPEWMSFPTAPGDLGHEGWGVVDAVGREVTDFRPGDRVALLSYRAYAEYDVAPASSVVKLPAELAGQPFPGEPIACAMNVFRRCEIGPGHMVAVIGAGFIGTLLIQLAKAAGARVVAISRRDHSLRVAREAGADDCVRLEGTAPTAEAVRGVTGGALCERVIEAAGAQATLDLAGELVAERGRLIIAGYHQDGMRQVNMQQWNWRGIDVVNAHERDPRVYVEGMREAVSAVLEGRLRPDSLYTHRFPLDRLGEALDATRDRPDGFTKALVLP